MNEYLHLRKITSY